MTIQAGSLPYDLRFAVSLRGPSAARFWPEDTYHLALNQYPTILGPLDIEVKIETIYAEEGFDVPVPRGLGVTIWGPASSLDEALNAFATVGNVLGSFVAVATNAAVGDLNIELGYDITLHLNDHDFFQAFLSSEQGKWPRSSRRVNTTTFIALLGAVAVNPDTDRLHRAIAQYQAALSFWQPGRELAALTHLYMAVEALTDVAVRAQCHAHGLGDDDYAGLAGVLGVTETDAAKIPGAVKSAVRCVVIFQNDRACYQKARQARNGIQHSFMMFDLVRNTARPILEHTTSYVRQAILDLAGIDATTRASFLAAPYDAPLGAWDPVRYLRGQLHGRVDQLAQPPYQHPWIHWGTQIDSITATSNGGYEIRPTETLKAMIGEEATFTPVSHEAWGPRERQDQAPSNMP